MRKRKTGYRLLCAVSTFLIFLGTLAYYSANWYARVFGDVEFEAVLFTILNGVQKSESSMVLNYLKGALVPCLCVTFLLCCVLMVRSKKHIFLTIKAHWKLRLFPFSDKGTAGLAVIISVTLLVQGASTFGLSDWLKMKSQQTTIYQDEYVVPTAENVVFEGEKRNLIYIYLESMENTFFPLNRAEHFHTMWFQSFMSLRNRTSTFLTIVALVED